MNKTIRIIDLFAGLGGFHFALHKQGAECVFASEIDQPARLTYGYNFQKIRYYVINILSKFRDQYIILTTIKYYPKFSYI